MASIILIHCRLVTNFLISKALSKSFANCSAGVAETTSVRNDFRLDSAELLALTTLLEAQACEYSQILFGGSEPMGHRQP